MLKICRTFYPWMIICIALVFISIPASADEIIVPSDIGPTIQAAIDNASDGDTITVEAGTYKENIEIDVSNLTIHANKTKGPVIIDAGGAKIAVGIYEDNITFEGFRVVNRLEGDLPEAEADSELDLFYSINDLYYQVCNIMESTNNRQKNLTEKYIEIFGILSNGSAAQIINNEVFVSSNNTIIISPGDKMIDAYTTGIAVFDPIIGTQIILTTPAPTLVYDNEVTVSGERHINHTGNSAINDNPTTLNLGIFAENTQSEIYNNTVSVSGNSIIEGNLKHPRFLGDGFSIGIWTRNQGGLISENTITAENLFYMGTNNKKGVGSAAWSIGIVPQSSDNVEVTDNYVTASANNDGVVINEVESLDVLLTVKTTGIVYGISIGIGTIWDSNYAKIDGNIISADGSVSISMDGDLGEGSTGTGAGIGAGILVPYVYSFDNEINGSNIITRNTVAGTSSANVTNTDYSAFELGAGVLIVENGISDTSQFIDEPGSFNIVNFNNLVGSSDYGLYVYPNEGPDVNAKYNWWGDCSGPYHDDANLDGKGDEVFGTLDFVPWINQSPPIDGHAFYGTVKDIDDNDVLEDVEITVYVDGIERGDIIVEVAGKYGSNDVCPGIYLIAQGDELDDGSEITFGYNGYYANEVALFLNGAVTQLNLTASQEPIPDPTPTPDPEDPTPDPTITPDSNNPKRGGGDGKERIIIRGGGESGGEPGGEGIMPTPIEPTPEPTATDEEAPIKGKPKSPWWWWLLLLLLAIGMITYYQWQKAK